jgi:hypothetical protein
MYLWGQDTVYRHACQPPMDYPFSSGSFGWSRAQAGLRLGGGRGSVDAGPDQWQGGLIVDRPVCCSKMWYGTVPVAHGCAIRDTAPPPYPEITDGLDYGSDRRQIFLLLLPH